MALNNLVVRTLSGIVIAVIIIAAIVISKWTLLALSVVITVGAMHEFQKLANKHTSPLNILPIAGGVIFVIGFFLYYYDVLELKYILLLLIFIVTIPVLELFRKKPNPLENIAVSFMGLIYIGLPMALLNCMGSVVDTSGEMGYNYLYPLGFTFLIWMNDVGAYMIGSTIGKNPLFPRISPNKSWEGFWGGFIITVAVGGVIGYLTRTDIHMWLSIASVASLGGVAGDLIESMFKREAGVKDSGKIIPGHGGFLDRFDAMLIALPLVFIIIKFFN